MLLDWISKQLFNPRTKLASFLIRIVGYPSGGTKYDSLTNSMLENNNWFKVFLRMLDMFGCFFGEAGYSNNLSLTPAAFFGKGL